MARPKINVIHLVPGQGLVVDYAIEVDDKDAEGKTYEAHGGTYKARPAELTAGERTKLKNIVTLATDKVNAHLNEEAP